jgi:hypothetical protein
MRLLIVKLRELVETMTRRHVNILYIQEINRRIGRQSRLRRIIPTSSFGTQEYLQIKIY